MSVDPEPVRIRLSAEKSTVIYPDGTAEDFHDSDAAYHAAQRAARTEGRRITVEYEFSHSNGCAAPTRQEAAGRREAGSAENRALD